MKFISIDQFNQASDKAKKDIIGLWQPSTNDWCVEVKSGLLKDVDYGDAECIVANGKLGSKYDYIPLLTIEHLIDYIECRTKYGIGMIEFGEGDCYCVEPYMDTSGDTMICPRWYLEEMSFCNEKLIQALWECACEVADDPYYDYED